MWAARNKNGKLRLFEMPPTRFHDGHSLPSELVGFNDAVSVGDGKDIYSFWAVQEFYKSNRIDNKKHYGYRLMYEHMEDGRQIWSEEEPEFLKDLKWEDEPVELDIVPRKQL